MAKLSKNTPSNAKLAGMMLLKKIDLTSKVKRGALVTVSSMV
jgi:hypothetical protein